MNIDPEKKLKEQAIEAAVAYYRYKKQKQSPFTSGSVIHYAGRVYDEHEITNLIDASLDFWLTAGSYARQFERNLAKFLNVTYCSLVNSGSSANLLAFMTLTSSRLGNRRIKPGDEIITVSAAFPTTVAPIVQYGAVPVFVDISLPSYNIDIHQLEAAISSRTRAVMIAHTLGNPFDATIVKGFCESHNLWLIEDNCDALGSKICMNGTWLYTGTIGDIGTSSFYPAHHITMGEGGAVYTNNPDLKRIMDSLRDWGRDCWCDPGQDNTCRKRFDHKFGELPYGYDHKYVYSHFGYNLKATDLQAAIGCAQLKKLPDFIKTRQINWKLIRTSLDDLGEIFILPEPEAHSEPSWFGFALTVKNTSGLTRDGIVQYLESKSIQTRMLFAGNLIRQPCFDQLRVQGKAYRMVSELPVTDQVMKNTFWIGVYPGLTREMIAYVIKHIRRYVEEA